VLDQLTVNPKSGVAENWKPTVTLQYYKFVQTKGTANLLFPDQKCEKTWQGLLEKKVGNCEAWAAFFSAALSDVGASSETVRLVVEAPDGPCAKPLVCSLLVNNWKEIAGKPPTNNDEFKIEASALEDQLGIPGQGNENPPGHFWDHVIVKAGKAGAKFSALYDPSYGTGPFPSEAEIAKIAAGTMAQPDAKEVLLKYQEAGIAYFCRPANAQRVLKAPAQCRKAVTGTLWLAPVKAMTWP
jgi:hypothetical protein